MNVAIKKFLKEEDGVTALEYGLLAAIVASALVLVFQSNLSTLFTSLFTKLTAAVAAA
ncbi:pilus assembly protein Flp/PilA [Pseudoxanthomonas sp. GM95]|uniref:Flp family type IVb pilin n=1 Tax=Pseudoxanthomonas sp. GM95 TaxID=1881043 RepID=UPI0008CDF0AB|nr:Flp family type IVb pilin [Pseudoxanthomonas sp. GM95]SEL68841.1 pilus assembly protein Flp/PilA [Pseudoxanthomonas sp. GM95]